MEGFRRGLLAVCAGAIVILSGTLADVIWQDYSNTLTQRSAGLAADAGMFGEVCAATFRLVDGLLARVVTVLPGEQVAEAGAVTDLPSRLRSMAVLLPDKASLWVADSAGTVVATSAPYPVPLSSVAASAGFRDLAGGAQGPRISLPGGDGIDFTVWRALRHGDGRFAGVVMARIDGAMLARLKRIARLGEDGAVAIVEAAGEGGAQTKSGNSLVAQAPVPGLPLAVVAAQPLDGALAGWRARATRTGVLGLLFVAAAVTMTLGLLAGLRREQQAAKVVGAARAAAEQASRAKSRFLAAVSHDLRQPVQGCRLFLDLLLGGTLPRHRRRQMLERASEALANLEGMLHVLLDAVRLENGQITPQPEPLALGELLTSLANECEAQAAAKGLTLRLRPAHLHVVSDPLLLQRLVRNLLVNAIRYTETGGVLVGVRRRGRMVRIEVWDTGPGIAADRQEEIFEAFTRLPETAGLAETGLGLGLAIVRGLGQALGHPVGVRSRLGRGTLFWLKVPLAQPAEPAPPRHHRVPTLSLPA